MSGSAWLAGAVAAGKRASAAQAARVRNEAREQYRSYAAESRACGYEVESFEEWNGETSSRAEADNRNSFLTFHNMDLY